MPFCKNCGKEVKEGTKFCPSCGTSLTNENESNNTQQNTSTTTTRITCPKCGSLIPSDSITCDKCGAPLNQDTNKKTVIIGYIATIILTLLVPFIGIIASIIIAIYLGTRDDKSATKHGIIMIVLAIVITIVYFVISYALFMNSLNSYYYY